MSSIPMHTDNAYKIGTFIQAKEFHSRKLVIEAYQQRIYYCSVVDQPNAHQLVYFERELVQPA